MSTIGVILAGGASSRMGQDKAMLSIERSTMLARTYQTLSRTSVDKVVISRNDGNHQHISDVHPGKGPLSGIHSVVHKFPESDVLVVPVDLPLLDVKTVQNLLDQGARHKKNTRYGEHSLPLYLRNDDFTRHTLDYTLRCTNGFSVNRFCAYFPLLKLQPARQSFLFNANTPEQWRFAMEHFNAAEFAYVSEVSNGTFY